MTDLQLDITALQNFAGTSGAGTSGGGTSGGGSGGATSGAGTSGSGVSGVAAVIQALPNSHQDTSFVNFGQFQKDNVTLTGFTDAYNLYRTYLGRYQDLVGDAQSSLNTLVSQLDSLASTATAIAQRYHDAQTEDVVSATDVDNALNTAPSSSQPT